jgi:hypothetical protein
MRPGKNGGKLKSGGVHANSGRKPKLPELDRLLADVLGEEKDGVTAAEAILRVLRAKAAKGDLRAAEILLDRGYGKARQQHEHSGSLVTTPPVINVTVQPPTPDDE